ncbi:ScbR family autoregulator-binding transcription factor [Paenarthrobacter nitroguajacolicus]|uniref:ScbR family autoregulator-binding transcription factor n=1 Tax=Paenarthrobacter nitroguajacolicus TaxID=211146 RepID=UPI00248D0FE0|nr:ScbR family autoregulator-binding transcription factor [Paenarthrobacter nitroguajacolicus]MDI2033122.1 A-factor receptor protein [Paenarthrobacter nitroguajacolicus]
MQQRAKETRLAVIEGAAKVFAATGYGNASLSDIISQAAVTKGALYFHFTSKRELALAVIEEQHSIVLAAGAGILGSKSPALDKIIGLCRMFGRQLLDEPIVQAGIRLTFEASAFQADVSGRYEDWIRTVEHLLVEAKAEGTVRPDLDPADFGRFLVASFTGVQMVSDVLTGRGDVLARIEQMWEFMLPAIGVRDR